MAYFHVLWWICAGQDLIARIEELKCKNPTRLDQVTHAEERRRDEWTKSCGTTFPQATRHFSRAKRGADETRSTWHLVVLHDILRNWRSVSEQSCSTWHFNRRISCYTTFTHEFYIYAWICEARGLVFSFCLSFSFTFAFYCSFFGVRVLLDDCHISG